MVKTMMVCTVLHNMVVEVRGDSYKSGLWGLSESALGRGSILVENVNEILFKLTSTETGTSVTAPSCEKIALNIAAQDVCITDEMEYF